MPIDPKSIQWDAPTTGIQWDDEAPKKPSPSAAERFATGLADPIHGGAQLLTRMLPAGVVSAGNRLNNALADATGLVARIPEGGVDEMVKAREYQSDGFDAARLAGNILSPASLALGYAGSLTGKGLASMVGAGSATGAASGALSPVTGGDFADEKAKQMAAGAAGGAAGPLIGAGLSRVVSPMASQNALLQTLRSEGVRPTVGQALGGMANRLEEKATSIPLMGDMITKARRGAVEDFNKAAMNRALGPVGGQAEGVGFEAVKAAGNKIGQAYDDALSSVSHVQFDKQFAEDVTQLQGMARSLLPDMRKQFDRQLKEVVGGRMSQAGAMLPGTFKKVDSELGQKAARYASSSLASEQELGSALKQLQNLLRQQAQRNDPGFAEKLAAADEAWANLVRIEGAAKAGKNAEGVFTPAQLNQAIQAADKSVRKRAVSRGDALMQDLGNAGQSVLGNRVPDSGTAGRLLADLGALGTGFYNPAIPLGLVGGGALYSRPVQNALVSAVASRPQSAQLVADALRKNALALSPALGVVAVDARK